MLAMVVGSTGEVYLRRLISYGDAGVVASYGYATVICGLSIALLARPVGQTFTPRIGQYAGLDEVRRRPAVIRAYLSADVSAGGGGCFGLRLLRMVADGGHISSRRV